MSGLIPPAGCSGGGEGGNSGGVGGGNGGGGDGGGEGGGSTGGAKGGDGGGGGGHAPKLFQPEPKRATNSALPSHAQLISSLFPSDKENVPCRVERSACTAGEMRAGRWEGVGGAQAACRAGPD